MVVVDLVTLALFLIGIFFFTVGTVGILRLPDVFTRMHATTKSDTLGASSILIGFAIYSGDFFIIAKLILIIFFVVIATPSAAHAIAKASYLSGEPFFDEKFEDAYGRDLR
jgi:multicomponent Na+:H+ antiporter subunit G